MSNGMSFDLFEGNNQNNLVSNYNIEPALSLSQNSLPSFKKENSAHEDFYTQSDKIMPDTQDIRFSQGFAEKSVFDFNNLMLSNASAPASDIQDAWV